MPEQPPDPLHYEMRIPPQPAKSNPSSKTDSSQSPHQAASDSAEDHRAEGDTKKPESD